MTKEEIDLYKNPKLQKLFKEKMGKWEDGDRYITAKGKEEIYIAPMPAPLNCYRIPDVVSRQNNKPERGLLGMIDHLLSVLPAKASYFSWEVKTRDDSVLGDVYSYPGDSLAEACLNALILQKQ